MPSFVVLNTAAIGIAVLLAVAARARERTSLFLLAVLAAYLGTIQAAVLLAGLVARLTVAGLAIVLVLLAVLALWLARPRGAAAARPPLPGPPVTPVSLALGLLAAGAGAVWIRPHLVEATRLWVWDDYTYHMVYPALWLGEQAIAAPTPAQAFTLQAWYPLGASVVATWFMVPFAPARSEALAWVSLTGLLYGGLVAAAAAELLGRLGCRAGVWALPVVLFATSSRVTIMAGSFSDADLAQAAALLGALAFAVPRGAHDSRQALVADRWFAGLLSGFALGVKIHAAPVALVILALLARRGAAEGGALRATGRTALVVGLTWCAMAGYWYARNLLHTGNPAYPAAFLAWPGTSFPETTLLEYGRRYGAGRLVTDALAVYTNWPALHAGLAALGLGGALAWWGRRGRTGPAPARAFASGVGAITMVVVLLLPVTPFSAGNALTFRSGFVHWDSMRYVAILPLVGWVALAFLLDGGGAAGPADSAPGGTARPLQAGLLTVSLGAVGLAALVMALHGSKAAATAAALHGEPLFGAAAAVLDAQPAGTRVAVFGDQWIYPAFGARHHLRPVRLDGDGRPARGPVGDRMEPGELTVDPATFRANLGAAGVGLVVVVRQPHPGRPDARPSQHAALEAGGTARLLHLDRAVAVWSLAP